MKKQQRKNKQIINLILPVIERKQAKATKSPRKSSKKSPKKRGKGFGQQLFLDLLQGLL